MSIPVLIGAALATAALLAAGCKRNTQEMNENEFKDYINAMYNPDMSRDYKYDHFLNESEERGYEKIFSWSDRWFSSQNSLLNTAKVRLIENIANKNQILMEANRPCQYQRIGNTHVFSGAHSTLALPILYESNIEMEVAKNPEKYVFCIEGHGEKTEVLEKKMSDMDYIKSIALTVGANTDYDTLKNLQSSLPHSQIPDPVEFWFLERVSETLNIPAEDSTPIIGRDLFIKVAGDKGLDYRDLIAAWFIKMEFGKTASFASSSNDDITISVLTFAAAHTDIYPDEVIGFIREYAKTFDTMESMDQDVAEKNEYILGAFNNAIEQRLNDLKKKYPDKTFVVYVGQKHLPAVEAAFGN